MLSETWNPRLNLRHLYTPLTQCVGVRPGKIDLAVIEELQRHRFDQAPVFGGPAGAVGVVGTDELQRLFQSDEPLDGEDQVVSCATIPIETSLDALLTALSETRGLLVVDARVEALITISDLNKHPFRVALYAPFAALEESLALAIERECPNPDEWLEKLPENDQVHILGSWEVSKRFSVDTGPLIGCTLTHLIRIATLSQKLRDLLGFHDASGAQAALGRLPTYRNKVMHPVRPLVLSPDDVRKLRVTVDLLHRVLARLSGGVAC
jgi:hypothetical protein